MSAFHEEEFDDHARMLAARKSPSDRQEMVRTLLVKYPAFNAARSAVQQSHYPVKGGTYRRGSIFALMGSSRAGKSFVLKHYAHDFRDERSPSDTIFRRVAYVEVLDQMPPYEFVLATMRAFGVESIPKLGVDGLIQKISSTLLDYQNEGCPVELIIFDDIDNALVSRRGQYAGKLLGALRMWAETKACSIICAGRERLGTFFGGKDAEQVSGRGGLPRHHLMPYDWTRPGDRTQIRLMLDKIDRNLPFEKTAGLGEIKCAAHLWDLSGGLIGLMMNYIQDAAYCAISSGAEQITWKDLAYAADIRRPPGATFQHFRHEIDPNLVGRNPDEDRIPGRPTFARA